MPNGKNTLSYKRKVVKESNDLVVGSKSVAFAHQASAGETFIPFNALVQPTRWVESGFNNPNGSNLLSLQLQAFADNIEVSSSAKGYIQKEEYVVKNNGIYFKDFVTEENEVFEVVVGDLLVTGNRIVDMRLIRVEGELADTETDFVIGNQVDVNKEEIIVFRDGIQMFRSDNNDDSGATGNYYYLDNDGDGKASSIRFFEAAVGTEAILVASTGGRVDSPNVSTFQEIEKLAGQIDAVIPTVAALAGVPESNFRAGPNYVDLKNFGDRLIAAESDIVDLDNRVTNIEGFTSAKVSQFSTVNIASVTNNFVTRSFNRVEDPFNLGVTLDGDGFIVPPGKYKLKVKSQFYRTNHCKVYFYDITNGDVQLNPEATLYYDANTDGGSVVSVHESVFVDISVNTKFEVRHWTETAIINGLSGTVLSPGGAGGTPGSNVATVEITKIG